jgi:type 1 glutamine amidotransferase
MKKALIVQGGWNGHTPKECAEIFEKALTEKGFSVTVSDTLASYADETLMASVDLIVPIWTMGKIEPEQEKGLLKAVENGAGLAGFHGGMCDSFRGNIGYQWMTGGQFMSHPGNLYPQVKVNINDREHEITKGISEFILPNTERYWMLTDPSNKVLAHIYFEDFGVTMPFVWTKSWGKGRVFFAAWGHTYKDFDVPQAKEIVLRGMQWAAR